MTMGMLRSARRTLVVAGLAALLAVAAMTGARDAQVRAQDIPDSFVGRVPGSDAFIGVVTDGQAILAYVCDSALQADWFRGEIPSTITGETIELRSPSGALLSLEVASISAAALEIGSVPRGTVETANGSLAFLTEVAQPGAGIFRAEQTAGPEPFLAGWIVLNDGDLRGALIDRVDALALRAGQAPRGQQVLGLGFDSIDLATLQANLPVFGIVDVVRVDASFLLAR